MIRYAQMTNQRNEQTLKDETIEICFITLINSKAKWKSIHQIGNTKKLKTYVLPFTFRKVIA